MIIATQFKKFIDLNFQPSYLYKSLKYHFREQHMLDNFYQWINFSSGLLLPLHKDVNRFFFIEKRKIWILDFDTCNGSHVVKSYILKHNLIFSLFDKEFHRGSCQLSPLPSCCHTSLLNCVLGALWQIFAVVHTRLYFVENIRKWHLRARPGLPTSSPSQTHSFLALALKIVSNVLDAIFRYPPTILQLLLYQAVFS